VEIFKMKRRGLVEEKTVVIILFILLGIALWLIIKKVVSNAF
tara:strand:+ start:3128 stop:3253 length:126 start_codon:yes stop_codon:yes gene_type:complete